MSTRTLTFSGADLRTKALAVDDDKLVVDAVTGEVTTGRRLHVSNGFTITQGSNIITELPKHDRPLTRYPEITLTASAENVSGYEGYIVEYSGRYDSSFSAWTAFGEEFSVSNDEGLSGAWIESPNTTYAKEAADAYNGVVGSVLTTVQNAGTLRLASNTPIGAWISLEVPNSIKLTHVDMRPRLQHASETSLSAIALQSYPRDFGIWGYDGNVWVLLKEVTDHAHIGTAFTYDRTLVNSAAVYKKYAIVITRTNAVGGSNTNDRNFAAIGQLYFYGYEEGDESVDVVHKSIPNKPGQQHLEVYWDANDTSSYSGSGSTTVTDLSGNGVTGTLESGVGFDTEYNAFTFDGTQNAKITGSITNQSGDWTHSTSFWVKIDTLKNVHFYQIGPETTNYDTTAFYYNTSGYFQTSISGNGAKTRGNAYLTEHTWYHIVVVKKANIQDDIYLNAQKLGGYYTSGTQLSLPQNTSIILGHRPADAGVDPLDGSIANFRLFNRALSADEVWQLYAYQKEYFNVSSDVVTFKGGRLGIGTTEPRAVLDVRGGIGFSQVPNATLGTGAIRDEAKFFGYYEEGTWVPVIHGSTSGEKTPSSTNMGWYVRIGSAVTVGGTIAWDGGTSISGQVRIKTLPYPSRGVTDGRVALSVGVCASGSVTTGTSYTSLRMVIDPGLNFIYLIQADETGSVTYSHEPTIETSGIIYGFGGTYIT